jgi:hypothetical protein
MTLRRMMIGLLYGCGGYLVGLVGGAFLVNRYSSNVHDRSLEAAMTGAFVFGPIIAIIAFACGFLRARSP